MNDADAALLALEGEGVVLRGQFEQRTERADSAERSRASGAPQGPARALGRAPIEWCDRALLARIHRYTVHRLRAEIEPVSPADFMRFLFKWQHVDTPDRLSGHRRPARSGGDARRLRAGRGGLGAIGPRPRASRATTRRCSTCSASRARWRGRGCRPPTPTQTDPPRLAPATPIALFLREHAEAWQALRAPAPIARRPADRQRARGCWRCSARAARRSSATSAAPRRSTTRRRAARLVRSSPPASRRPTASRACAR